MPATVFLLVSWFFFCLLFLAGGSFLLWKWPTIFPKEKPFFPKEKPAVLASEVLGVDDQQQLNLPLDEQPFDEQPLDERITILEQFLSEQNSPLASQAATMIEVADTYKFDWRLLPAIAGKESSYGKNIPWDPVDGQPSHNAWGWGVYGNKTPTFSNWEEAANKVAEGLRQEYYNEGYITPELIVKKFTPRSDGSWERDIETIMEQIAPEEKQNDSEN